MKLWSSLGISQFQVKKNHGNIYDALNETKNFHRYSSFIWFLNIYLCKRHIVENCGLGVEEYSLQKQINKIISIIPIIAFICMQKLL